MLETIVLSHSSVTTIFSKVIESLLQLMRPSGVLQEFLVTLTRMTLHIEEKLLWKLLLFSNFHKITTELDALNDDENSYNSQR